MLAGVELPEWAGISGVSRQGAARWLHAGVLPVTARQTAGTILVDAPGQAAAGVAVCGWVSSCGQRSDLGRPVAWVGGYLTAKGIAPSKVVCGVGSGLTPYPPAQTAPGRLGRVGEAPGRACPRRGEQGPGRIVDAYQAFRFELDPSNITRSALASHAGGARFAYGWGLRLVKSRLDQGARIREGALVEGASDREAEALARTVCVPWSLPALRREWNRAKGAVAPWWAQNSKECYSCGLDGLARGLEAWSKSRRGERQGAAGRFSAAEGETVAAQFPGEYRGVRGHR